MEIPQESKKSLSKALLVLAIVLSLYFAVKFLAEFRYYSTMRGENVSYITLSGHGEVQAVPDIANVYFTIRKEAKTVKEAQTAVAEVEAKALSFLKENKVEEKDIKTANASFNPKYEYRYEKSMMPCSQWGCPPNQGKNVIVGYEAYESITVKIRNTDEVGKIMQGLGTLGVEELNGPNFTIDNEDGLKAEARKLAIDDAREKGKTLAADLGVKIVRISSFNDSGNDYPYPMMYSEDAMMGGKAVSQSAPAQIPKGENTITSDVTIVYEIR